uniref:Transmembrane protein 254 n=1 Tax=Pundamilia nyererei TaxID=303518 RepID=A0A3B4F661_9CICH
MRGKLVSRPEKSSLLTCGSFPLFGSMCIILVLNVITGELSFLFSCFRWWLTCAIHLCEALVALKLCSNKGIKDMSTRCLWFIQTFLFGFASLHLLIKYDPERSKQD